MSTMNLKRIVSWVTGMGIGAVALQGQITSQNDFTGINAAIPDGNLSGWADTRELSGLPESIQSVTVTLDLQGTDAGAFNGDFYAYLSHGGGIAVLLNRVGVTGSNPNGYADNGFNNVTFNDAASNGDVHLYQALVTPASNGALTGTWAPDGRNANPLTVTDATSRTATLSSLTGLDPNGGWTLFIADVSGGGTAQINGWSLSITAVPEPEPYGLVFGALLVGGAVWRRRRAA